MPNKHKLVDSYCVECSRLFQGRVVDVKRNRVKYCSPQCRSKRVGRFYSLTSNPIKKLVAKHPNHRPFVVLSACVGNFSRSVLIEGILKHHIDKNGLRDKVFVISGGIMSGVAGEVNNALVDQLSNHGIYFQPHAPKGISNQELRSANLILTVTQDVQDVLVKRLQELYPHRPTVVGKSILFTTLTKMFGNDPDMIDPDCVGPLFRAETINRLIGQIERVVKSNIIPALKPLRY